ncbi:hypothetical protein ACFWZW_06515 [Microbacterium enclense]|uniref:hypothetical protein n=1 Tax=Microbacterium enclense TaxID=993073 RepID=UPI0036DD8231
MGAVIVLVLVLLAASWAFIRRGRGRTSPVRDDTLRAGGSAGPTPAQASRRAEGKAAWTRLGGGV